MPGTESHDPLIHTLRALRRRLALQRGLRYAAHGLWIGATLASIWLVATRLFPALGDPVPVCAGLAATSLAVSVLAAVARRPSLLDTALEADRRLQLRERITSSLQLEGVAGPMVEAVHADARRRLEDKDARAQFTLTMPKVSRWAIAPVVLFGIAYVFLPEFDLLNHNERAAEARLQDEATAVRVERLKDAAKPLAAADALADGELSDTLRDLASLTNEFESGAISEKQALARMSNLADKLHQHRRSLSANTPDLNATGRGMKTSVARELANAIQQGKMGEAAAKAAELRKKLESATEAERKKLAEDLKKLSESLAKEDSALAKALAKSANDASTSMEAGDAQSAQSSLEEMLREFEDQQSILDQLEQMDTAMQQLEEWEYDGLGESEFCRQCGQKTSEEGECENGSCSGSGHGAGMGGGGHGEGNEVGELPDDVEYGMTPTRAKGPVTKGKMIAEILQRSAPEAGEEASAEYISGAFVEVQQEAEQALTQEEIPPASKEFVRQYFGSLEPEDE